MKITLQELSDYNEMMKKAGFIPTIDLFLQDASAEPTETGAVIYPEDHDYKETCTCNV